MEQVKFQLKIQGGSVPASEISVPKDATGSVLLDTIKNSLAAHEVGDMKVLCAGKRILGDTPVCSLRNSSPLLVLGVQAKAELQTAAKSPESRSPMAGSPQRDQRNEEDRAIEMENAKLDKISEAALEFSRQNGSDGDYHAEIVDQSGKRIGLPENDRRNLIAAQVLHEHGRKLMKDLRFEDAIKVLRDSTKLFLQVSPALLKIVDNYGLCCLDLSWCFLKLGNVAYLDTAREHLNSAQFALELAHGKNLERLMQVRGEEYVVQKTLYVRLAVLRGVVCFHRGEHISGQSYFAHAEDLMHELRIEDSEVEPLLLMGFSKSEARRGLRLSRKNVEEAVICIMNRREQLEAQSRARARQRRQDALGSTADGQAVDLELLDGLIGMGFEASAAASALRQTNNDAGSAADLLANRPDLLATSGEFRDRNREEERAQRALRRERAMQHLRAMGFEDEAASLAALRACRGNVEAAADMLLSQPELLTNQPEEEEEEQEPEQNVLNNLPPPVQQETEEERLRREREEEIKDAAKADLVNALAGAGRDNDEQFDLNLDDEMEVLLHYKQLMAQK